MCMVNSDSCSIRRENIMERIMVCGDEKDIVEELSKYVNGDGVRVVVRNLLAFSNMIDDDEEMEIIKEKDGRKNSMGFVLP